MTPDEERKEKAEAKRARRGKRSNAVASTKPADQITPRHYKHQVMVRARKQEWANERSAEAARLRHMTKRMHKK